MNGRAAADAGGPGSTTKNSGRRWYWLGALLLLVAGAAIGIHQLLQPERMGTLAITQAEQALGLTIVTDEPATLAVWPGLRLRLNGVTVLDPADGQTIGSAQRVDLALPLRVLWSQQSELGQIELLAPTLRMPALRAWLARSADDGPPAPLQLPAFASAISVDQGRVVDDSWELRELRLELGPVRDGEAVQSSAAAEIVTRDASQLRFSIELQATPRQLTEGITLEIASLALQMESDTVDAPAAALTARGEVELQPQRLSIDLQIEPSGMTTRLAELLPPTVADALRPNLEQPLRLSYSGTPDFDGRATLDSLDPTRPLHAGAELAELINWLSPPPAAEASASPLPPVEFNLAVPSVPIGGLTVEGLKIEMTPDAPAQNSNGTAAQKAADEPNRSPQP